MIGYVYKCGLMAAFSIALKDCKNRPWKSGQDFQACLLSVGDGLLKRL